ncbi:MAG: ABC transporter permease [Flammeovirgaceae bacterium]
MRHLNSIRIALLNVKNRFFHTFLSILGIVIGVAALVGTLSLIDGMEKFAHDQVSTTTDLQVISIRTNTYKTVNEVRIRKENYAVMNPSQFAELLNFLTYPLEGSMMESSRNGELILLAGSDSIKTAASTTGQVIRRTKAPETPEEELLFGRNLSFEDVAQQHKVCVINSRLASVFKEIGEGEALLGKMIRTAYGDLEIVGVGKKSGKREPSKLVFPISLLPQEEFKSAPPFCAIKVADVEQVTAAKAAILKWIEKEFPTNQDDFAVVTNEGRVKQLEQVFLVSRVVMGLIVGLSVLVGGIGVMNVMLISVNERTTEIGICKAMGAKRKDIFIQFLSESVTISGLGSLLGLIVGVLATMVFVPVIKSLAEVPFQADYTLNTLLVIGIVALLVGVLFGTYPALRASKLNPVEAMRRE